MIKLGSSLLLIAVTAGLAAVALNGARQPITPREAEVQHPDVDAWFI
jgi:hypothetical protein